MADRLFALFALIAGGIYTYVAFGCATGIIGYGICDYLLGLNLPEGLLAPFL